MRKSRSTALPSTRSASWYAGLSCAATACATLSNSSKTGALVETTVIHLGRVPSRKNARASLQKRASAKLCISGESVGVVNGAIRGNPIRFWHGTMIVVVGRDYGFKDRAFSFAICRRTMTEAAHRQGNRRAFPQRIRLNDMLGHAHGRAG